MSNGDRAAIPTQILFDSISNCSRNATVLVESLCGNSCVRNSA